MKTYNTYFTNEQALTQFIQVSKIEDSASLLIQIFTSENIKNKIKKLINFIDSILPQSKLIGCTTDGEIKDGLVSTAETVISFTLFENTSLRTYISNNFENYFAAGCHLANALVQDNNKVIISFIDGLTGNGEEFLNGISSIDENVKVAGGLAGDNANFHKTFVFTKQHILQNAVAGVSLSSLSLNIHTNYSFDWLPIGKNLTITKSTGNRVYTIDDKTAYETYRYYLGKEAAKKLPSIGIEFPLIIERNGISIARAVIGSEADGSLIFAGNINEGDIVRFGYGDSNAILSHNQQHTDYFYDKPIESLFIYSCMARRRFMPNLIEMETKPYNQIAPTSGFFTYGEFYSSTKKELLNQTMTILALSESKKINKNKAVHCEMNSQSKASETIRALSSLITVSTNELEQANSQLAEEKFKAEKATQSKSEFISSMSHELRTPMNAIIGFSQLLEYDDDLNNEQLDSVQEISKAGTHLLDLINQILDLAKIESGQIELYIEPVEIYLVLDECLAMMLTQMKKYNVKISHNCLKGNIVQADFMKLKQVFINLISNAIKYNHNGGSVTIEVEKQDTDMLQISITDTGPGISQKDIDVLFKPFNRLMAKHSSIEGTGIGLTITQQIVEIMGGEIGVTSELDSGSTFWFTLPIELKINA